MSISINEKLDTKALAKDFASKVRVQIKDFLQEVHAERIFTSIATETPWQFTYNDGDDIYFLSPTDLQQMITRRKSDLSTKIFERARTQFQFVQQDCALKRLEGESPTPEHLLDKVQAFFNSKEFLKFAKSITGLKNLQSSDAWAVFFNRDQFYGQSDGQLTNKRRKVGFHFGLTKDWRADWGGYHCFFDENDNIEEGYKPLFNALTLFKLPQTQSIQYIPTFTGTPKFGIHGYIQVD